MTPNNNLSILPFYDSLAKQDHRKDYAFGELYPLFSQDRRILPFQILRFHRSKPLVHVKLRNLNGSLLADITTQMLATGLQINTGVTYDTIVYPGVLPLTTLTPEGPYYLELYDSYTFYFSEVFTVVRSVDEYLKIEFRNLESLEFTSGIVDFTNDFKFKVYLPTQLGRPEYEFEEVLEKRDGYDFIEKQISEKTFKFNFLAPEFLCDAMRIIRMCDIITITSKSNAYIADSFLITPKWQDGGHLAAVEAEFQCDTVIKKIGSSYNPQDLGDFNDDFNDDFDNA